MKIPPETKTCSMCGETKPVSEYNKDSHSPDGLRARCKPCRYSVDRRNEKLRKLAREHGVMDRSTPNEQPPTERPKPAPAPVVELPRVAAKPIHPAAHKHSKIFEVVPTPKAIPTIPKPATRDEAHKAALVELVHRHRSEFNEILSDKLRAYTSVPARRSM